MSETTHDRGEIMHFAGFHHLSPALDVKGEPAFSCAPGDGLARCGWALFFESLERRRLVLTHEPADPASARLEPPAEAHGGSSSKRGVSEALAHARRFLQALLPQRPPGGTS